MRGFVRPWVRRSVRRSIALSLVIESKSGKLYVLDTYCECSSEELGVGVLMGVGRPCPPVRNDIVTPRYLLSSL